MATKKGFWDDAYKSMFEARITSKHGNDIVLDETFFYPASGGQASDAGTLVLDGKEYAVTEVFKDGEEIIHKVKPAPPVDLQPGMRVRGIIDWQRRIDLMRGHTAQHMLSAYIFLHFKSPTIDVSIQPGHASISVKNPITLQQLEETMVAMNEASHASRKIVTTIVPRERAVASFADKIRGEMSVEDPVRIVEITDWDIMCCGGTHVKDSAEIGPVIVTKFKGGRELRFVVGKEARIMLGKMNAGMLSASIGLNKEILQVAEAVDKQSANLISLDEQADNLSIALLEREARLPGVLTARGIALHVLSDITNKKILTAAFNQFPPSSILVVQGKQGSLQVYSNSDGAKANEIVQALVANAGGKGGGNPKIAQGMLERDPGDITARLKEIIEGT